MLIILKILQNKKLCFIDDIAKIVKKVRKQKGLTQIGLAQLSNVGTRFLSDLENGKPTCETEKVIKILTNLGVKLEVKDE